jgi:hypothetical protein
MLLTLMGHILFRTRKLSPRFSQFQRQIVFQHLILTSYANLCQHSSCCIYFSFTRVAEEATIVYAGLQKTSGDTHRCLHSMLDLGNSHVLAGAEWWTEEYKPRLLACGWNPIKKVTSPTTSGFGDGPQYILLCVAKAVPFRFDFGITTDQLRFTYLTSPLLRTR